MRKLISLFTGAGGLDLGFEAAGFETKVAVEMNNTAISTLEANRDWPILHGDIHDIDSGDILAAGRLKKGQADALIGGPPCQPFSKAGYWATGDSLRLDDPKAGTLAAYLRVLRDTLPKSFLMENVPGLAFRSKSEGLDLIRRTVDEINQDCGVDYTVSVANLNAAEFGVPQMRERVFVVGARDGKEFQFPTPTHRDPAKKLPPDSQNLEPFLTTWDAIGDLEETDDPELIARGKWADLLPSIPEGENYLWHTNRRGGEPLFGWRRKYWSFLLKLSKNRPSWTVQASPGPAIGPFHWKSRRLSAEELCRLQTFPDGFRVLGSISDAQKQLGNAVPSGLAEVLARSMRRQLLGSKKLSPQPTLIPSRQLPVPPPEPTRPVERKYLDLVGSHKAHPGTGKGYAASKREDQESEDSLPSTLPLFVTVS